MPEAREGEVSLSTVAAGELDVHELLADALAREENGGESGASLEQVEVVALVFNVHLYLPWFCGPRSSDMYIGPLRKARLISNS